MATHFKVTSFSAMLRLNKQEHKFNLPLQVHIVRSFQHCSFMSDLLYVSLRIYANLALYFSKRTPKKVPGEPDFSKSSTAPFTSSYSAKDIVREQCIPYTKKTRAIIDQLMMIIQVGIFLFVNLFYILRHISITFLVKD